MSPFVIYLSKVSLIYGLCFVIYWLLFRRETFFLRNRFYLLISMLLPPVIPLIEIPVTQDQVQGRLWNFVPVTSDQLPVTSGQSLAPSPQAPSLLVSDPPGLLVSNSPSLQFSHTFATLGQLLLLVYLAGAAFFFIRMLWSYLNIGALIWRSERKRLIDMIMVITKKRVSPFSLFKWLVIPLHKREHPNLSTIIRHERIHYLQHHSIDLLLSELLIVFQWFNPIAWLLKTSIIRNNEFFVDRKLVSENTDVRSYQYALLASSVGERRLAMVNSFNRGLIKKRIEMMNKKDTRLINRIKDLLIVPFAAILILAFSAYTVKPAVNPIESTDMETLVDDTFVPQDPVKKVAKDDSIKRLIIQKQGDKSYIVKKNYVGKKGEDLYVAVVRDSVELMKMLQYDSLFEVIKLSENDDDHTLVISRAGKFVTAKDDSLIKLIKDSTHFDGHISFASDKAKKVHIFTNEGQVGYMLLSKKDGEGFDIHLDIAEKGKEMLMIVDGKESDEGEWSIPDVDKIYTIRIFDKDEAVKKYGEKAKHGAIVITTKEK